MTTFDDNNLPVLSVEEIEQGIWLVYIVPSNEQLKKSEGNFDQSNAERVAIMTLEYANARYIIHPIYTTHDKNGQYTKKYKSLDGIAFDWIDPINDVNLDLIYDLIEMQPRQFIVTPDFGLGIKRAYRNIIHELHNLTNKKILYIGKYEPLETEFKVSTDLFEKICAEIDRISTRARTAETEVKNTTIFNVLADANGIDARPFRLGRNEIRKLIQNYTEDQNYRDPIEQKILVTEISNAAHMIAVEAPEIGDKLVSNLQLSRLEVAISKFESLLKQNKNEVEWQNFFESDPFVLAFAFGYPISFVNGQTYVGGRKVDGKGEKIADFLYKNSLNNNAALIEIKKPSTILLKEYRDDVYSPHYDLSGGITQILDQKYRFSSRFATHRSDNEWFGENEVADFEIDCILLVGTMPVEKHQRKSFQMYRKNSHGVKIITFDEVLEILKQVLSYLKSDDHVLPIK